MKFPWNPLPVATHRTRTRAAVEKTIVPGMTFDERNVFDLECGIRMAVLKVPAPEGNILRVIVSNRPGTFSGATTSSMLVLAVQSFDLIRTEFWPYHLTPELVSYKPGQFHAVFRGGIVPQSKPPRCGKEMRTHAKGKGRDREQKGPRSPSSRKAQR